MYWVRNFVLILGVVLACSAGNAQAGGNSKVASPAELQKALRAASGGTITLAPGEYGLLSLTGVKAPAGKPLVLRSANAANPARFSGMLLQGVHNMTLESVVFDYTYKPGDKPKFHPFKVLASSGVTLRNNLFDGDDWRGGGAADNGFPTGFGLRVRASSGVTVENNEIRGFFRGTSINRSQNVVVRGNDIHSIRMDGMNFAEVTNVLIEKNHIHDFTRSINSTDHADMIQFWTNRTKSPSRNITIRNNLLNSGQGWYTQSIFMRNEEVDTGRAGHDMFYRNIKIENNMIINAQLHGISIGEADGLTIRNNTVVRNARSEGKKKNPVLWVPQIRVKSVSRNVEISRNITSRINGPQGQADWRVQKNFLVQDRTQKKPGFYGDVFDPSVLENPSRAKAFIPRKGSALDKAGAGARHPVL